MAKLTFYEKEKFWNPRRVKQMLFWAFQIVVVVAIAWVLAFYIGQRTPNAGDSMLPAIENGQDVWINRMSYLLSTPKRYDVVVFWPNGNKNSRYSIKRVIGLPGETIQIKDQKIYIDNKELTDDRVGDAIEDAGDLQEKYTLKTDEYFVLGDNRNSSEDSRYADPGMVDLKDIIGKAWLKTGGASNGWVK